MITNGVIFGTLSPTRSATAHLAWPVLRSSELCRNLPMAGPLPKTISMCYTHNLSQVSFDFLVYLGLSSFYVNFDAMQFGFLQIFRLIFEWKSVLERSLKYFMTSVMSLKAAQHHNLVRGFSYRCCCC